MNTVLKKLSIIIPAYNEARTIHLILDKVLAVKLLGDIEKEIIIVNDCSKDDTRAVIEQYIASHQGHNIRLYNQEVNRGKGAALHKGISLATGEYLVIQDADLEYDPNEYNVLLRPVLDGFADVVYGSRFMGGRPHRILFFWHTIGNRFLTFLSNMFTNLNLSDMETCYKLFRTDIIQGLKLEENRFGFEPEVTAKISRIPKIRIYEVGISYYGRTYEEGKKIGWKDGFRAIWCIFKYGFTSTKVYRHLPLLAILFSLLFCYSKAENDRWKGEDGNAWKGTIGSDGRGYYAYLPAIFIYHDLQWNFIEEQEKKIVPANEAGKFLATANGRKVDKYFAGEAILGAPFFLCAHLYALAAGEADGYSFPYHCAFSIAALFYLCVGLYFLAKFLRNQGFSPPVITCVLLLLVFATNLEHYAVNEPTMSHVYSFALFAIFIYAVHRFTELRSARHFYLASAALALISITRPSNFLLITAVPFLAGSWENFTSLLRFLFSRWSWIVKGGLLFLGIIGIQCLLWYLQCGKWAVWSYSGEKFDFSKPQMMNVLFGFRKGLFVYTPLALFIIPAFILLLRKSAYSFLTLFFFLALSVYVVSSWWCWWYGGSFGMRALIEYFPFLGLALALVFSRIRKVVTGVAVGAVCIFFLVLNQVQMFQYDHFILHWEGMNFERYKQIFFETSPKFSGIYFENDNDWVDPAKVKESFTFFNDFEGSTDWGGKESYRTDVSFSGKTSSVVDKEHIYSPTFVKTLNDISPDEGLYFKASMEVYQESANDLQLVISFEDGNSIYNWNRKHVSTFLADDKKWHQVEYILRAPAKVSPASFVKVYAMISTGKVYIDDFTVQVYALKP